MITDPLEIIFVAPIESNAKDIKSKKSSKNVSKKMTESGFTMIPFLKTVIVLKKKSPGLEVIAAAANSIFEEDKHLRRIKLKIQKN